MNMMLTNVLNTCRYAWTQLAHLVVLESPAGVGYSYCKASNTGGSCHNTDKSTAAAARAAMQDFFKTKFPELTKVSTSFAFIGLGPCCPPHARCDVVGP